MKLVKLKIASAFDFHCVCLHSLDDQTISTLTHHLPRLSLKKMSGSRSMKIYCEVGKNK